MSPDLGSVTGLEGGGVNREKLVSMFENLLMLTVGQLRVESKAKMAVVSATLDTAVVIDSTAV